MSMLSKDRSREIRRQIREVLMQEWDPIGVKDVQQAQDEYDMYVGEIYQLLIRGVSEKELSDHLLEIEYDRMEMEEHPPDLVLPAVRALREITLHDQT